MKLYDGGRAPNPRRTRIFLAEKDITVPTEQVDLGAMAHMSAAYAAINPLKRLPALVLDDGTVITRSEEHTSELQSRPHLVCRLLLEKKKKQNKKLQPKKKKKNKN